MSDPYDVYFSSNRLLLKDAHIPGAIFFFTVTLNMCVSSVWELLHVAILEPRILRRLLDLFEKLWVPAPL